LISDFKFPFCPLPSGKIIRFAGRFRGMGSKVARIMPNLAEKLRQSELGISPEDYGAVTVVMATAYFVHIFFVFDDINSFLFFIVLLIRAFIFFNQKTLNFNGERY